MCWPSSGAGFGDGHRVAGHLGHRTDEPDRSEDRVGHVDHQLARGDVAVVENLLRGLHRPDGQPGRQQLLGGVGLGLGLNHLLMSSPSQPVMFLARSGPEVVPSLPTRSGRSIAAQNFAQSPSVATMRPT